MVPEMGNKKLAHNVDGQRRWYRDGMQKDECGTGRMVVGEYKKREGMRTWSTSGGVLCETSGEKARAKGDLSVIGPAGTQLGRLSERSCNMVCGFSEVQLVYHLL